MIVGFRRLVSFTIIAPILGGLCAPAFGADAAHGAVIAKRWCAACHVVAADQRSANADAPPFADIARRLPDNKAIAAFLTDPHPKMPDMSLTRREIEDIVAYIRGLGPKALPSPAEPAESTSSGPKRADGSEARPLRAIFARGSMVYSVKEAFLTLQGEGRHAGRAAVFCRFSGCNLWTGREKDRARAVCGFCDTDFVGVDGENGGRFPTPTQLAAHTRRAMGRGARPVSPCSPAASRCSRSTSADRRAAWRRASRSPSRPTERCPSRGDRLDLRFAQGRRAAAATRGDELKLVYPQAGPEPERFDSLDFEHFLLQPMDGPEILRNTRAAIDYCLAHPRWRLSCRRTRSSG